MTTQNSKPSPDVRSLAAKAAYSRRAGEKMVEARAKLDGVRSAVAHAIAAGNLNSSEKLESAKQAIEMRLAMAESRLEILQKSGEEGWEDLRYELENAWDDLSGSINKLVARIKDESD